MAVNIKTIQVPSQGVVMPRNGDTVLQRISRGELIEPAVDSSIKQEDVVLSIKNFNL